MSRSLLYPTHGCRVYKTIEVTLEDLVRARRFVAGAVVLDHLVRMEDVGTYLTAPFVGGRGGDGAALRHGEAFGLFFGKYLGLQELQRLLAVRELTALARNMYGEVRRRVENTHRRLTLVHVLGPPAPGAGAIFFPVPPVWFPPWGGGGGGATPRGGGRGFPFSALGGVLPT